MYKYLLGMVAGMSIVPFAYFANSVNEGGTKFYIATILVPILIVAFTAIIASKIDRKHN